MRPRIRNGVGVVGMSLVISLVVSPIAGCGGSSSGGVTSVPGTKTLKDLTPAELATLCSDSANYFRTHVTSTCKLAGFTVAALAAGFNPTITDAQLQALCNQGVASCNSGGGADAGSSSQTCDPPPATCTATVSEYSACLTDDAAAINSAFGSIPSCSSLTRASLTASSADAGTGPTATTPASCTTLETKCPGFFQSPGGP
jgi:hypothetical protein